MSSRVCARISPQTALVAVIGLSLLARAAWIEQPCHQPCRSASAHVLVFDETYYVNAARVIAGLSPPRGQPYASAPRGEDPNAEHPQLAKLVIAGSIELLGDGPLAWRLGSLIAGTIAVLGMFSLVRAAGGGPWLAVLSAALMAADNLMVVQGRIGTLDVYVLAAMVWSVALYLRGHRLAAGIVLGVGTGFKLVAPFALLVLLIFEAVSAARNSGTEQWRSAVARLAVVLAVALASALVLLAAMDRLAPPYDPVTGHLVSGGVLGHIGHMLGYGAAQVSARGPTGIASYPWWWLVDLRPIVYLNVNPARPAPGLTGIEPPVHFLGVISPPVLLIGVPALVWIAWRVFRGAGRGGGERPLFLALAWFIGTFVPFVALSLLWQRTSYLYYMVIVMPALYLACAWAALRIGARHRRWALAWTAAVVAAAVVMYPFTPLP